ncbi:hypothetical protein Hypma_013660 [Hypsizygus marmoreus]|uniref:Uncharacterized protein n=1 Tax=Hypsizygus marmoreus TaxID=39966 RepID=A0A369JGI5_HYPMA|nr:hypothetical protein Hypma_013660 [Hypsizygus marmoreus]
MDLPSLSNALGVVLRAGGRVLPPLGNGVLGSNDNSSKQDLLPPINRIPVEILAEVFFRFLEIPSDYFPDRPMLAVTSRCMANPFILGHVCIHWRAVALSTPTLWSSLAIHKPASWMAPMVQIWLQRAKNCPLSLYLYVHCKPSRPEIVGADAILPLFVMCLPRWKNVTFYLNGGPYDSLLGLPNHTARMLECALLDLKSWDHASADQVWRSLSSSPKLRRVFWDNRYMLHHLPAHMPWTQLTHLRMDMGPGSVAPDALLELLRSCQELVELHFVPRIPIRNIPRVSPFILPKLRVLTVQTLCRWDPSLILGCLILPALASINIRHGHISSERQSILYLKDLLARSSCQLKNISLWDTGIEEAEIVDFLSTSPAQFITALDIDVPGSITEATIALLTHDPDDPRTLVLTHLKTLKLHTIRCSDGVLSKMIRSRLPYLEFCEASAEATNLHLADRIFMASMQSAGFNFSLDLIDL